MATRLLSCLALLGLFAARSAGVAPRALSLINNSEPTRHAPIWYGVLCL
jgi:hypothetical protein